MTTEFSRERRWGQVQITLDDDEFLRAGYRNSVRSRLMHRLLSETVADLEALDAMKDSFISGSKRPLIDDTAWNESAASYSADELMIAGQQVMQAWETRLMAAMADVAARSHGDVLEVGFGMGISATLLQERGISSHTIIELNDDVFSRAEAWRAGQSSSDINLVHGKWQDVIGSLGKFDAIFYDAYPISESEIAQVAQVWFPDEFFGVAKDQLRPRGVFTYYTDEMDSLSRWHQRRLLEHFRSFTVEVVRDLHPPPDCNYWWAQCMAVVCAYV